MTVTEILENLKLNTLPNITRHKQTSDDFLINVINAVFFDKNVVTTLK